MPKVYSNFTNKLSPTQQVILDIIHNDPTITNQEIADIRNISLHTVKHHLTTIYEKMGLDGKTKRNKRVGLVVKLRRQEDDR